MISERVKNGEKVKDIAAELGVSRQAVYQRLKKEGHVYLRKQRKTAARYEILGVTKEEYLYLRSFNKNYYKTPMGGYYAQRNYARRRGIQWDLRFVDWWRKWEGSGCWLNKGRGDKEYKLERISLTKGFSRDNIHIVKHSEDYIFVDI